MIRASILTIDAGEVHFDATPWFEKTGQAGLDYVLSSKLVPPDEEDGVVYPGYYELDVCDETIAMIKASRNRKAIAAIHTANFLTVDARSLELWASARSVASDAVDSLLGGTQ